MSHAAIVIPNYRLESARWATGRNVLVLAALISIVACVAQQVDEGKTLAGDTVQP